MHLLIGLQRLLDTTRVLDFLAPLALRLYLAPVFWMAGTQKLGAIDATADWFGNPQWGLGLPFPSLLAWAAALTEAGGAVLLVLGLGVRWISLPLMATMAVAALAVHWENGWLALADSTRPEISERLERARMILHDYGDYEWLTAEGGFVILNNGIEWAATYFIMLLTLFFIGAGRWLSLDHWLRRRYLAG